MAGLREGYTPFGNLDNHTYHFGDGLASRSQLCMLKRGEDREMVYWCSHRALADGSGRLRDQVVFGMFATIVSTPEMEILRL